MPFKAFLATSSGFIVPEEPAMILVSSGRNLFSAIHDISQSENHPIYKLQEPRMKDQIKVRFFLTYYITFSKTRSFCIWGENQRNMNVICNNFLLQCFS